MHPDDPEHVSPTERTRFWRTHELGPVEWLAAAYRTHRFTRHWHETYALGTVESGGETFMARGERHYVRRGSLVLLNPGDIHDGETSDPAGWRYRMLYPALEVLARVASEIAGQPTPAPHFRRPVVEDPEGARVPLGARARDAAHGRAGAAGHAARRSRTAACEGQRRSRQHPAGLRPHRGRARRGLGARDTRGRGADEQLAFPPRVPARDRGHAASLRAAAAPRAGAAAARSRRRAGRRRRRHGVQRPEPSHEPLPPHLWRDARGVPARGRREQEFARLRRGAAASIAAVMTVLSEDPGGARAAFLAGALRCAPVALGVLAYG